MAEAWLSIIGIGEDGVNGLSSPARALLAAAAVVYGGKRHLDLAAGHFSGEGRVWQSPIGASIDEIIALAGQKVVVLASGDPFEHGIGVTLAARLPRAAFIALPGLSAFTLAANALAWPLEKLTRIGLNGRALQRLRPHLQPGQKILALSTDGSTPSQVADYLRELGFGPTRLTVLERLGGAAEKITHTTAAAFDLSEVDPLNLIALDVVAEPHARILPRTTGLPDAWFMEDGQITKREIRAVSLSALAPQRGEVLYDIGGGSGSIGIEWMLSDPLNRAVCFEQRADRAARITANALALGVPDLEVVVGHAPECLPLPGDGRPADAVFIGGGGSDPALIERAYGLLRPGGRLVVNGVTLETEARLIAEHAARGGELIRLAVERAGPVGGFTAFRPAMTVVQWSLVK